MIDEKGFQVCRAAGFKTCQSLDTFMENRDVPTNERTRAMNLVFCGSGHESALTL
ncbi:MAG: hypothetical protein ACREFR_08735 [Limisphaerales bacterium]